MYRHFYFYLRESKNLNRSAYWHLGDKCKTFVGGHHLKFGQNYVGVCQTFIDFFDAVILLMYDKNKIQNKCGHSEGEYLTHLTPSLSRISFVNFVSLSSKPIKKKKFTLTIFQIQCKKKKIMTLFRMVGECSF